MKYWCDEYDTYAAETLDDVKAEKIAAKIISEDEWDSADWSERDGSVRLWIIPIEDLEHERMKNDSEYKAAMEKEYLKTLDEVFSDPSLRPDSETGRAWFMCSTEW